MAVLSKLRWLVPSIAVASVGAAFGLAAAPAWYDDPWYSYPAYDTYYYDTAPPPAAYGDPGVDGYVAPAPPASGQAPAACGSWQWDTGQQIYHWIPCAS